MFALYLADEPHAKAIMTWGHCRSSVLECSLWAIALNLTTGVDGQVTPWSRDLSFLTATDLQDFHSFRNGRFWTDEHERGKIQKGKMDSCSLWALDIFLRSASTVIYHMCGFLVAFGDVFSSKFHVLIMKTCKQKLLLCCILYPCQLWLMFELQIFWKYPNMKEIHVF